MADSEPTTGPVDIPFIITQVFDAPRGLVFKAWTEGERLARWFGPKELTIRSHKNDLCPGGIFHYSMQTPNGQTMWGKWAYQEIVEPERLVFVASFSDEVGGIVRAPFNSNWPLEVLSTVLLTEHEGKTTLTMYAVPVNATEIERKTFADGHGSMQHGWNGTLDQLAEYLASP